MYVVELDHAAGPFGRTLVGRARFYPGRDHSIGVGPGSADGQDVQQRH